MGRAYPPESRDRVKALLEQGRSEEDIEKETQVSDRTIRRWKLELERFGRIGKPPESRTGRHRVLGPDVETALFTHVAAKPDMSVDDMLWWLYDQYKLVVGTRTIRRAFERRNTSHKKFRTGIHKDNGDLNGAHTPNSMTDSDEEEPTSVPEPGTVYQSPYAPIAPQNNGGSDISPELARALGGLASSGNENINPELMGPLEQISEDEETLQLQLQQIALQKKEVELKLRMRRLQKSRHTSIGSGLSTDRDSSFLTEIGGGEGSSSLTRSGSMNGTPTSKPRDSRSKNKIEEARIRTAERQERMLKDLEKRSRRREHLTVEWVQSKDIWPQRAQILLTDLMHRYGVYAYNQTSVDSFEMIFRELYQLVDHRDWYPPVHDDLLRERTRRKMAQVRSKMVKSGEIISRGEGYGGWSKSDEQPTEMQPQLGDEDLSQLPDLSMDMDMHAGADRTMSGGGVDVDDNHNLLGVGPAPYPQPQGHEEQDVNIHSLQQQGGLSAAHAQALMAHQQHSFGLHHDRQHELSHDDFNAARHQHELLAQQGMAQQAAQEQMATRQLEQDIGRAIAGQEGLGM